MRIKISKSKFIYGLAFLIILLNTILEQHIHVFAYLDELVAIVSIIFIFIHIHRARYFATVKLMILFLVITIITGVAGNIIWGYQESIVAVLKDILAYVKAPIIACALIMRKGINKKDDDKAIDSAYIIEKFFLTVMFILSASFLSWMFFGTGICRFSCI